MKYLVVQIVELMVLCSFQTAQVDRPPDIGSVTLTELGAVHMVPDCVQTQNVTAFMKALNAFKFPVFPGVGIDAPIVDINATQSYVTANLVAPKLEAQRLAVSDSQTQAKFVYLSNKLANLQAQIISDPLLADVLARSRLRTIVAESNDCGWEWHNYELRVLATSHILNLRYKPDYAPRSKIRMERFVDICQVHQS